MTYCRSHYCARMRVHTYHGFIQLFAEFAGDNFDEQAVRVLLTTYKEFDDMHLALLNRNIDDITKRICADGRQLVVTYPLQVAFAEQIRTIFPVCQSEHTPVNMRILGQNVSRYLNFHDLPIFRDEEYIFDILWKYSAKSSPISIYANNVLDHLVRVLKEGFFRIAQCMVLFFVYTLKMVCKLVEYNVTIQLEALSSRAPETSENEINTRAEQRYCMQICDQLNAKLIGVFKEFVDIVGAATTTNTYERQLNEEQIRHHTPTLPAASSSSALLDTVTMEGGEEEQKSNCTLS